MTGLLLVLAEPTGPRADAAIELAAAAAALGRPVALFLTGAAAGALAEPAVEHGIALLAELGAGIGICQTAMARHGIEAHALPAGVEPTGLVHLLAQRADWQLVLG